MDTILIYAAFGLSLLANVLHFLAPRTKSTLDDRALEIVTEIQEHLPAPSKTVLTVEAKKV